MIPVEQLEFLKDIQSKKLALLVPGTPAKWGVMNPQEMTEHLDDFYQISLQKIPTTLITPQEDLPKYLEFLYSDKSFKENTKAPASLLGEKPLPLRQASLEAAIANLQQTTELFLHFFENANAQKTLHPVFGMLNFEEWVRLHYKHVTHHFRQFGLIAPIT